MPAFNLPLYLWVAFAPLVGAFLGAYFKRRAEDIAINANFENVLEQLRRQTAETENIKAAISEDIWDRQERWKVKRDAVIEVMRDISSVRRALIDFATAIRASISDEDKKSKAADFYECFSRFFCSKFVAELCTGKELERSLDAFQQTVGVITHEIRGGNPSALSDAQKVMADRTNAVIREARKELGMPDLGDLVLS